MSTTFLKMKIVSLAAEARLIRREEHRFPGPHETRMKLREHRIGDVRSEARAALLAYGYLRGRPLHVIEATSLEERPWRRVAALVKKYGPKGAEAGLEAWEKGGPGLEREVPVLQAA